MHNALTSSLDTAQVVLYAFWIFFAGLIYWLRKEDRREGYPLETDNPRIVGSAAGVLAILPAPKTFLLPEGGTYEAPSFRRDGREVLADRTAASAGSPIEPKGDPMLAGVGPGSYAERSDHPELTRDGRDAIVPLRVADGFSVSAGPDPRGWDVVATDGKVAGKIIDIWVDRSESQARYLEVELSSETGGEGTRLIPVPILRVSSEKKRVEVSAIRAAHFAIVPELKEADRVTLLEEDRISAFYAGGRLYAEPKRLGPVL
jgi:photosynthetic reaction center H subunit